LDGSAEEGMDGEVDAEMLSRLVQLAASDEVEASELLALIEAEHAAANAPPPTVREASRYLAQVPLSLSHTHTHPTPVARIVGVSLTLALSLYASLSLSLTNPTPEARNSISRRRRMAQGRSKRS